MIQKKFKSIFVIKQKKNFTYNIQTKNIDNLNKDEVIIKTKYSSYNYKDFLVCTGKYWDARKYPITPGIDFSGIVVKSKSKKFKSGEKVVVIASPAGSKIDGGLSEYVKIHSKWVNKIPKGLNEKNCMIFGTAGFTSMYVVQNIIKNKITKSLPILVTGASGGVGSFAIFILSKIGFNVIACTRTNKNSRYLKSIGAKKIILEKNLKSKHELSLQKPIYSTCVDTVGGKNLSFILKRLHNGGICYSVGFSQKNNISEINLTPFILRGIKLYGIHTESINKKKKDKIWVKIASFLKLSSLPRNIYKEYKFNKIKEIIKKFRLNKTGKFLIKIS
jgi:acrylyl-CoA reductase (NADPH)